MIRLFVLTQLTNVSDGQTDMQTDRQTPHDDIGRAAITFQRVTTSRQCEFLIQNCDNFHVASRDETVKFCTFSCSTQHIG